jgi:hypothetical protein
VNQQRESVLKYLKDNANLAVTNTAIGTELNLTSQQVANVIAGIVRHWPVERLGRGVYRYNTGAQANGKKPETKLPDVTPTGDVWLVYYLGETPHGSLVRKEDNTLHIMKAAKFS